MSFELNHTHDLGASSWVKSANADTDFPIQNLPLAVFRRVGSEEPFRGGVAIGDRVLDLRQLSQWSELEVCLSTAVSAASRNTLNEFLEMGRGAWKTLRHGLFDLLHVSAAPWVQAAVEECLVPMDGVEFSLPIKIGNYTDFYTSLHHAHNVGQLVRPDNPVTPNFHWMPIAYHGRASSVCISGTPVQRPMGQQMPPLASKPNFDPCQRLDYELELGVYIGQGNCQGSSISANNADAHIFGLCLLNDWSARDIQFWEAAPLGPFLAKNFATTVSPWIVTAEALLPYRKPWEPGAERPDPLPYLDAANIRSSGVIDIDLEVWLDTARGLIPKTPAFRLSKTNFCHQYWTIGQMIAHHTVGGCNLQPGDLLGTGTISGPTRGEAGALIELTIGGKAPIRVNEQMSRTFLEDGDRVTLVASCQREGFSRIGFGQCAGTILPCAMHMA